MYLFTCVSSFMADSGLGIGIIITGSTVVRIYFWLFLNLILASWRNYDLEPIERFFYKETVSSIKKHRTPRPLIIQFTDSIMTTGEGNDHLPKRFFRAQPASTQCAVILRVLTLTTKLIGSNLAWHKMQSSDGISTSLSSCEKLEETLIEAAIFLRVK